MALAGGIYLMATPQRFIMHGRTRLLCADERCRAFDDSARGIVLGEAAGFLLLKDLESAQADGDRIHAVIKATGVNQDGRCKGLAVPNPEAQTRLVTRAPREAGIDPETISLMEARGTGTRKGDANEVNALIRAWRTFTDKKGWCALGSAKANVGYSIIASLAPGIFKIILAFKHGMAPPAIHFSTPNQLIDFDNSPFFVNREPMAWARRNGTPQRAAISAVSYAGSNFHMVLEEPPKNPMPPGKAERVWDIEDVERQEAKMGEIPKNKSQITNKSQFLAPLPCAAPSPNPKFQTNPEPRSPITDHRPFTDHRSPATVSPRDLVHHPLVGPEHRGLHRCARRLERWLSRNSAPADLADRGGGVREEHPRYSDARNEKPRVMNFPYNHENPGPGAPNRHPCERGDPARRWLLAAM